MYFTNNQPNKQNMNLIYEVIDEHEHSTDVISTSTRCAELVKTPLNTSYAFLQGPHVHKFNLWNIDLGHIDRVLMLIQ